MKYYKVKFFEKEAEVDDETEEIIFQNTFTGVKVFKVESDEELQEKINDYISKCEQDFEIMEAVETKQVTVDELIQDEMRELWELLFRKYLFMKLSPAKLDAKKYAELKAKYLDNKDNFYELLKYEIKTYGVEEYLGRYNKHFEKTMKEISAKQFFDRVKVLSEGDSDTIGE